MLFLGCMPCFLKSYLDRTSSDKGDVTMSFLSTLVVRPNKSPSKLSRIRVLKGDLKENILI